MKLLISLHQTFVSICICVVFCNVSLAQDYPSQEEHEWVSKNFFAVLKEFLPIQNSDLGYRSYKDVHTDVLEYSFSFEHDWKEKRTSVVVRKADSASIYDQIMTLHGKNPLDSIDSIKAKLKVKKIYFNQGSCPEVKTLYDEFYRLNLSMMSAKDRLERSKGSVTITLHPVVHTFEASISGGNLRLVLTDEDHSFVVWAGKTRRVFERCRPAKPDPS